MLPITADIRICNVKTEWLYSVQGLVAKVKDTVAMAILASPWGTMFTYVYAHIHVRNNGVIICMQVFRPDGCNGFNVFTEAEARSEANKHRGKKISAKARWVGGWVHEQGL